MPQVSPHGLFTLTRSVSPSSSVTWSDCSDSCCLDQQPLPISAIVLPRPFSSTVPPCVRNTQTVMNFSGIIDRHKLLSIFLIKPLVKKKKKSLLSSCAFIIWSTSRGCTVVHLGLINELCLKCSDGVLENDSPL